MKYTQREHSLVFGFPLPFTTYFLDEKSLRVRKGFLNDKEIDYHLYKIIDVQLEQSLPERLLHLGTLTCYLADKAHSKVVLNRIGQAKEIKAFILRESEKARVKARRIPVLDIGYKGHR